MSLSEANMRIDWCITPGQALRGALTVPGDKSISHRAIMLASIAEGVSRIQGFLEGEDTRATARAFVQLGVKIETPTGGERIVHGVGLHGLSRSAAPLDMGNAGTAMRLMTGLMAGQRFESTLIGDASLSKRPMKRVIEPLTMMGAHIESQPGGLAPLHIRGGSALHGIHYATPVASAQIKSSILLAGLYAQGETVVHEPHPTRDYTESMLRAFGVDVQTRGDGAIALQAPARLIARDIGVPSDFSSAAFWLVAASIIPDSELLLKQVGINPRRTGLLEALRLMGAKITLENASSLGGEQVADVRVRAARLHGIEVPESLVPDMIDECPILFVAAAFAEGVTTLRGAAELRVKESDRIAVMAKGLRESGIAIEETPDGAVIRGGSFKPIHALDPHGDHRCAMSFALAAWAANQFAIILDCANVATSYPEFKTHFESLGGKIS